MKKTLLILLLISVFSSCSTDDDSENIRTANHDISFSVTSTDDSRLSNVELKIMNNEVEINESSYSNTHLPLTRNFDDQKIKQFTILEVNYRDNSDVIIGVPFEPYTVSLVIKVDDKVKAEKEFTVSESGYVDAVVFIF